MKVMRVIELDLRGYDLEIQIDGRAIGCLGKSARGGGEYYFHPLNVACHASAKSALHEIAMLSGAIWVDPIIKMVGDYRRWKAMGPGHFFHYPEELKLERLELILRNLGLLGEVE